MVHNKKVDIFCKDYDYNTILVLDNFFEISLINQIDLHNLNVEQAINKVSTFLQTEIKSSATRASIIVGQGNHSFNNSPRLRKRVLDWLVEHDYVADLDGVNLGNIIVNLVKSRERRLRTKLHTTSGASCNNSKQNNYQNSFKACPWSTDPKIQDGAASIIPQPPDSFDNSYDQNFPPFNQTKPFSEKNCQ